MAPVADASVIVIGAGPAGLAASRELAVRRVDHVVLERGDTVAPVWHNLYDSLVLHTGRHMSALPGLRFPASTPLFPTRIQFIEYLERYAQTFELPIRLGTDVVGVRRAGDEWVVVTNRSSEVRARCLVVATGIVSKPYMPDIPTEEGFAAVVAHSVTYRRPDPFAGSRVLVVGAGNSAGEISAELARAGVRVTVAVRSGARAVPRTLLGVPIQYVAVALDRLPPVVRRVAEGLVVRASRLRGPAVLPQGSVRACSDVPLIGFGMVDGIRSGAIALRRGIAAFTREGVRFEDGIVEPFDHLILATGYRAALGPLEDLVRLDDCGFAMRHSRVVSADQPNLFFMGQNYRTGGLRNIGIDAKLIGAFVERALVRP